MSVDKEKLLKELRRLKKKILALEKKGKKFNEQDTRNGLINPLFEKLDWEFDGETLRCEFRRKKFNEPVDYAFFRSGYTQKPLLLVEAKALGTNLQEGKFIRQICAYLVTIGAQWGVLTDGNTYMMYNTKAGDSYEEHNFLTLQIKNADTEDDIKKIADDLIKFIGRDSLENNERQNYYDEIVIDRHIENALKSLFTKPFDVLTGAIRTKFKLEHSNTDQILTIKKQQVTSYLEKLKNNEGKISFTINDVESSSDNAQPQQKGVGAKVERTRKNKRETIPDLFNEGLIKAGDIWHFNYKGKRTTGKITDNGQLEVNGVSYDSPSAAGKAITGKECAGWDKWRYGEQEKSQPISDLRERYRKRHNPKTVR